jgi:Voltage-dependent anion channel
VVALDLDWAGLPGPSDALPALAGLAWLALLCAGALGYVALMSRFDPRDVTRGPGDHWIAGGVAAISALACATLARTIGSGPLSDASVAAWIVALVWLPVLAAGELRRPRAGRIGRRWSTVFPLGMYAAMSFAVARVAHLPAARAFARGWTVVAALAWLAVTAAALAQARRA